ncbi:MAG: hypothetical protein JXA11_00940 [Phycisphaerae bacterium]|nr:hypothetical protein [Phycisphaerae bacterium]
MRIQLKASCAKSDNPPPGADRDEGSGRGKKNVIEANEQENVFRHKDGGEEKSRQKASSEKGRQKSDEQNRPENSQEGCEKDGEEECKKDGSEDL